MITNKVFRTLEHKGDLCIVGGGLAGTIAALAAARHGAKVVLIQDRPMLGGNCSSEIRMWVRGAKGVYNREMGILNEFEEENIYRNPTLAPTLWDSVLFGKIKENGNITLLLNASCVDAKCENGIVTEVTAWQLTTYTWHKVSAKYFADCSGDSILAPLTGAMHRIGREANSEYGEKIGPAVADSKTMGMSLLLQARETEAPVKFTPPEWANVYETDEDFAIIPYKKEEHSTFRDHKIGTSGCNLWWMELGGDTDAIHNTEEIRDELIKVAFGIWDHIKNRGDHGYENWELEWVGFLPGKRESVRYIGEHILTEHDIMSAGRFDDVIAYGGWPMDDHNPKGMKANTMNDEPSICYPVPSPYGIPYRVLYSKNISNLFFAGRNISATHAALSSTRVMATCSLMGQAMGTAAAICTREGIMPGDLKGELVCELQNKIMDDGVSLPYHKRSISELTRRALVNLTDEDRETLFNGMDKPTDENVRNCITLEKGSTLTFDFGEEVNPGVLRICFDPDYERKSISPNMKMQVFPQKLHQGLDFVPVKVAKTIVKSFEVYGDGQRLYGCDNNYYSLVKLPLEGSYRTVEIKFNDTWGDERVKLFACDFI